MADVSVTFGATDEGLEKTLKSVQGELNNLKEKVKGGGMSMTELEATMKRIGQVSSMEKNIKAIGDQSKDTTDKVKNLGKTSEEAGEKAKLGFGKIAIGAGIAGAAAKAGMMVVEGAFAVATKTVASFGDALNMGGRLADLSDRTGVAVDKLLILERAFQNTGVGADSLGPIINKMQKAIVDAGDGSSKAADAFTKLGLPLSTLENLSPDEQLKAIGKAIAGIPDPAERAAVSMEIFGKSGGALNQVFANMDGELETAKAQLGSLPDVMKAGAAQFDKISDNLTIIGGKFVEFAAGIIDKVNPALDAITTALTRIDAAKLGQDLAGFFTGAGEGMKGFQAAVDAIDAGEMGTAFKIIAQAIQLQFKETGNSIYASMVAAFKTVGDFIMKQFASGGPLVALFQDFGKLISAYITEKLYNVMADFMDAIGKSGMASTFRYQAETSARAVETALNVIPIHAELAAEKAGESMGNIPENFKENMAGVPPLFTGLEKHQQEIDRLQQSITGSTKETTNAISEQATEKAKAEQEARKHFQDHKKFQEQQEKDEVERVKKQDELNAKLAESAAVKRDEIALQLKINDAIASGNTEEAKRLNSEAALNKSIEEMIKSGMGEEEATRLANELERASRAAERTKNSLATKIGDDIKKRQESEAVDPGGKLMKKAQDQISAGRYADAEATARQIQKREREAMIRGTGEGKDRRAIQDIGRDYGLRGSDKEIRDQLYKIRTEGQGTSDSFKKTLESTQKRMGLGMKKDAERKTEEKKTPMTLEGMVKAIQTVVEKLEMKLPQPVMV